MPGRGFFLRCSEAGRGDNESTTGQEMPSVTRDQENMRIILAEGEETTQGRQLLDWASDDDGVSLGPA